MRDSLAAWHLQVPRLRVDSADLRRRSSSRSPTSRRCGCAGGRATAAARRGHALVHDRLRARHADHEPADDAARARAGDRVARRARRAPGPRGRRLDRRRAREDPPRAPPWPCGRDVVRHLLRHRGRDAALPRAALRGVAVDRRRRRSCSGCASPRSRRSSWIDAYGDRDGDGFVEYERRTPRGLENQSWKDSGDSQRFHDGSFARTPIAPAEVQGYVYDAKLRLAELARAVWDDVPLAERLEARRPSCAGPLRRALLGRGARRLLRARAGRREAARRLALLEPRASALERYRPARAGRRRSRTG